MAISIGQLFVRNWPIKLAAIFFAIMLYVAVAAQQPLTQSLAMHVAVAVPPGRSIRQQPANVTAVIIGKGTEAMKLRSLPHVSGPTRWITRQIARTFLASAPSPLLATATSAGRRRTHRPRAPPAPT